MTTRFEYIVLSVSWTSFLALSAIACSKPVDTAGPPPPSTTVGTELDDSVITSSVKSALIGDPEVKSYDFKVETRKGEVMLSGFVDNQMQVDRATSAARAVSGVKAVQNNVLLKANATTVGAKLDDSIITGKVKAALMGDASIKSLDIAVVTRQGEVLLSGFVDNKGQIDRAVEVARGVEGVRMVSNEMAVKK